MGMTDECRIGHYTKRLIVIGQLFGDASYHLARICQQRVKSQERKFLPIF
jgi:pimeloyl-CoA dehydrogenase